MVVMMVLLLWLFPVLVLVLVLVMERTWCTNAYGETRFATTTFDLLVFVTTG